MPAGVYRRFKHYPEESRLTEEWARQARQAYYASVSFADAQIGRVLDALDERGLADNTVVVFTSDHGFHLGEHGIWKKGTLFENAARVPLIFAGPGIAKGHKTDSLAEMETIRPQYPKSPGQAW